MPGQSTRACATESSCAGAEAPGPTAPERPYPAVTLMTAVAFVSTVIRAVGPCVLGGLSDSPLLVENGG
jgi:hypothetical protein